MAAPPVGKTPPEAPKSPPPTVVPPPAPRVAAAPALPSPAASPPAIAPRPPAIAAAPPAIAAAPPAIAPAPPALAPAPPALAPAPPAPAQSPAALAPSPLAHALAPSPSPDDESTDDDGSAEDDRAPPPELAAAPHREMPEVRTLADVRGLLRRGDADGALAALYRLRRAKPTPARAAEIATLLGNLYFDRRWWSDGLKEYRFAISIDPRSRTNGALINNTVRALGDRNTYPRARRLLVSYVGRSALSALRRAARSGSPLARRNAQAVLAQLEHHK
jgi:hypothetical protein